MNRQEAIRILKKELEITKYIDKRFGDFPEHREALDMAIKALEQEPTTKNIPTITIPVEDYLKLLEGKQEPILDKIRAEIETKYGQCKLTEYIVQYDGICTSTNDIGDIADILQIIDKYKAESEG